MAGGFAPTSDLTKLKHYEGHVTFYLIFACLVASSASLIFGYELGISGGVTSMNDFLQKFFPKVYQNVIEHKTQSNNYCRYSNQILQLFTSSLYLAGAVSNFLASYVTRYYGRRPSILVGGLCFLCGGTLNGAAQNIEMLIIGRIFMGIGLGFSIQAFPLYLSEMSPPKFRGFLFIMAQSATTFGILIANLINYGTNKVTPNGWRISLGLVVGPAVIQTLGGIFLPDTPNSLVERGYETEGRRVLEEIRGVKNVDVEFEDLLEASNVSKAVKFPWKNLLKKRYRPQLVTGLLISAFQQLGGNDAVTFYAPVLFKSIGFGSNAALFSAVILGSVKVTSIWMSTLVVDKLGRKILFCEGGLQMAASQIAIGIIFQVKLGLHNSLDHVLAVVVVVLICAYAAAFDWSWGPLAWLVPSEIYPLEIRSAAQSLSVAVNFFFTFLVGQIFLTLFCHLKAGTFFFFAGWLVLMTAFIIAFLPETKNIPIESMSIIWTRHWFWKSFVVSDDDRSLDPVEKENGTSVKDHSYSDQYL